MNLYHVTPASNLESIMKDGLVPRIGSRSRECGETEPAIWLFTSLEATGNALENWLGEVMEDVEGDLALLAVEARADVPSPTSFEVGLRHVIVPSKLAILSRDIDDLPGRFFSESEIEMPWLLPAHAVLEATPEAIAEARTFLLARWQERAASLKREDVPTDLSESCIFTSLFARTVFGGSIIGNQDHLFNLLPDGQVLDLNAGAADVVLLGEKAYARDPLFLLTDLIIPDQVSSCESRVRNWVDGFIAAHQMTPFSRS